MPTETPLNFDGQEMTKRQIMELILKEKHDFRVGGFDYAYRHETTFDTFIYAELGKKIYKKHHLIEDDKFVTKKEEEWPRVQLFFNISDINNPSSQLVAFEINNIDFASAHYILAGLGRYLDGILSRYGYCVKFEAITDQKIFWKIIGDNEGQIKSLKFIYHVPNLFGNHDALTDELTTIKNDFGGQRLEAEIINDDANLKIPTNSKFINESVDHVKNGGGKYQISTKNETYTSENEARVVNIENLNINVGNIEDLSSIVRKLFEI